MPGEAHVQLSEVSKTFRAGDAELEALRDITLDVASGGFLSLLGPSGCGKTTLLRIIGGLLEPTSGHVSVGGQSPSEAQAGKALGFVFQDPSLLPWRTVVENIRLPLEVNRRWVGFSPRLSTHGRRLQKSL